MDSPENKNYLTEAPFTELHDALADEQLQAYLDGEGPLRIHELPRELSTSSAFEAFVNEYDWPNGGNAGKIAPVHDYDDAPDFWKNTYDDTDPEKYLNNFSIWLETKPVISAKDATRTADFVGFNPALHRGYVVAESLLSPLREIIRTTPNLHVAHQHHAAMEKLGQLHPEVPEAAYAAYRLFGRLMTKNDMRLAISKMSGWRSAEGVADITDAHHTLWQ